MKGPGTDGRVVIIGAGPSGLSAAVQLRRLGVEHVTVLERESEAGGVPRHTDHMGFGLRDMHRVTTGPRYARRLVVAAVAAGVVMRTATTVIDVADDGVVLSDGSFVAAGAVILATGVRERPRSARVEPGDRPAGVFTTGTIQQLTALHHRDIGHRAVIVGAEHVSFSAIWTLRHGGCQPVAMVTPLPHHQSVAALRHATATRYRVPVLTGVDVASIEGRQRVQAVMLSDGRRLECDTVVFTGGWIPDHELAMRAALGFTPDSRAPAITNEFMTSRPGVFAVGNLVHPAETADMCALDGRRAAAAAVGWLRSDSRPECWPQDVPAIRVDEPIRWASFNASGLTLRVRAFVTARVEVTVADEPAGKVIAAGRRRSMVPNRAITLHVSAAQAATMRNHPLHVRLVT
jgi:thioredoxin reductase